MTGRKKKDVREIETEALTSIDQTLVAAENFLSFDVEESSRALRQLMKGLGKARTTVADMRQRYIEREYPIAAAQRSYKCPRCEVRRTVNMHTFLCTLRSDPALSVVSIFISRITTNNPCDFLPLFPFLV